MVRKLLEERDITLYCDLHGHSRKHNVFHLKVASSKCKKQGRHRTDCDVAYGDYEQFHYGGNICGSSLGKRAGYHFNTSDFESMGYHLCDTLLDYCDPDDSKYVAILRELELKLKAEILARMRRKGTAAPNLTEADIDLDINYTSDIESSTGGSDSSVSDGLPMHLIYAPEGLKMESRKKKLKTRKERNKRRAKAMKVKDVLLADVATRSVQHQDPPEVKLMYQKHHPKRSAQPSPTRMKMDNPQPRKHEHKSNSRSCTPVSHGSFRMDGSACRHDYLEAVTNAYMMSGVLVTESKEVPHFRYTDGTTYLKEAPSPERTGNLSRWSVTSPPQPQGFEISEEEGHFTVSYLAKQLERKQRMYICSSQGVETKKNQLCARFGAKITMYNNRYKTAGITGQETEPVQPSPTLRPRTPVQPYPYFPWQPKGDCLSSTKARLYEAKPVNEKD
ncbi:Cytosolic carboxypeptidase 2 [Desmophyllum pertusum]|uniref:Cytosolic carboxypeptidase 2 n=1 Tax=Desmophyllum pertusum TaxID=174260 RepID=A0A9W9Z521_9CNID|nr:Cytosolic carboxypeptidase 2 [Desmophyllum pertusum]